MNYKYTAEELLSQPETIETMLSLDGTIETVNNWIIDLHSRTENYKNNIFYHVIQPKDEYSSMNSGVGEGLYLGKDYKVLVKFYGLDYIDYDEEVPLQTFQGNPNFLDLTDNNNFDVFKESSKQKFPFEKNNNELKKMTLN